MVIQNADIVDYTLNLIIYIEENDCAKFVQIFSNAVFLIVKQIQ